MIGFTSKEKEVMCMMDHEGMEYIPCDLVEILSRLLVKELETCGAFANYSVGKLKSWE
ncbi:hypothetical protein ACJIZ3_021800 [Penstemon smallii]|uniref:Uncharacterized protein n=1 Tax=Penstemon smallii TaxID=265156 RepID=A0ABD3SMG1_9LAMI